MIKERPILFSTDMVRAILDGHKTQTRRVIKEPWRIKLPRKVSGDWPIGHTLIAPPGIYEAHHNQHGAVCVQVYDKLLGIKPGEFEWVCPFGLPGDQLWVRERHAFIWPGVDPVPTKDCLVEYYADNQEDYPGNWPKEEARGNPDAPKWRPSIHMPRWASRIMLEITSVRVEKLQDISDYDQYYEGLIETDYVTFAGLWNKFAKEPYSWDNNPWVWVIEFRRLNNNE